MSLECSRQQDSASKGSSQESGEECNVCHFDQQSEQWLAADVVGGVLRSSLRRNGRDYRVIDPTGGGRL